MQTAVIADQNGGKMWKRQTVDFLASAIKEGENKSKKATPDAVSIKQPKTMFEFGLPSIIAYSPKTITVPRSVRSCRQFLQDSIHCHFLLKA